MFSNTNGNGYNRYDKVGQYSFSDMAADRHRQNHTTFSDTDRILQALDTLSNRIGALEQRPIYQPDNGTNQMSTTSNQPINITRKHNIPSLLDGLFPAANQTSTTNNQPIHSTRQHNIPSLLDGHWPAPNHTSSTSKQPIHTTRQHSIPSLLDDHWPAPRLQAPPRQHPSRPHQQPEKPIISTNSDFHAMTKALYRAVQIRRHMENWQDLPRSINKNLEYLASLVRPTDPNESIRKDIQTIFERTGTDLKHRIQQHFEERLEANRSILIQLNPADKSTARDTVFNQIRQTTGRKLSDAALKQLLLEESTPIGREFEAPTKKSCLRKTLPQQPTTSNTNRQGPSTMTIDEEPADAEVEEPFITQGKPTKKPCLQKTPPLLQQPTTSTSNRYEPLAMALDADDEPTITAVEEPQLSPLSPRRKTPRRRTTPTSENQPPFPESPRSAANIDALIAMISEEELPTDPSTTQPSQQPEVAANTTASPATQQPQQPAATAAATPSSSLVPQPVNGVKNVYDTAANMRNKGEQWRVQLNIRTHTLILSDSNMRMVEVSKIPAGWQLAVLPGARLEHLPPIMTQLPYNRLTNIIIAVGINNRQDANTSPSLATMEQIVELLHKKSRNAYTLGVSFHNHFPPYEQDKMLQINRMLASLDGVHYINPVGRDETTTLSATNIHYNQSTVSTIWFKILSATSAPTKN